MIDLHVHSVFSDGELLPSEIARRMAEKGVEAFAITDHADFTNIRFILENLLKILEFRDTYEIEMLVGIEITHVPPRLIGKAVELALKEGAEIILVHGETIVEPVKEGTNYSAVQEEIDILAHPGIIDEKTAEMAKDNKVFLELSARKGHCLANGHIAKMAEIYGYELVINTDTHSPSDIISRREAEDVIKGAGIENTTEIFENSRKIVRAKKR